MHRQLQQPVNVLGNPGFQRQARPVEPQASASKQAMTKIVEIFMKVLWCGEPDKVIRALDAAVAFCNSPHAREERDELSRIGMHAVIVGVMNNHFDNVKIQIRCCYLLILTLRLGLQSTHTVGVVGGLRAVLIAMETFPDHSTMQSNACVFLFEFYREDSDYSEFLLLDGSSLLVDAVMKHPTVEALQHSACGVIGSMCLANQDLCSRFISLGAFVHVAQVIQNFPNKVELQQVACDTMTVLMKAQKTKPTLGPVVAKPEKASQ